MTQQRAQKRWMGFAACMAVALVGCFLWRIVPGSRFSTFTTWSSGAGKTELRIQYPSDWTVAFAHGPKFAGSTDRDLALHPEHRGPVQAWLDTYVWRLPMKQPTTNIYISLSRGDTDIESAERNFDLSSVNGSTPSAKRRSRCRLGNLITQDVTVNAKPMPRSVRAVRIVPDGKQKVQAWIVDILCVTPSSSKDKTFAALDEIVKRMEVLEDGS